METTVVNYGFIGLIILAVIFRLLLFGGLCEVLFLYS